MPENIEDIFKTEGLTWKDFPILFVDDEPTYLEDVRRVFDREFKVFITDKLGEVSKLISEHKIAVVASDQRMPEKTGVQLLSEIKKEFPNVIRILITGYSDYDSAIDAINKGEVYRYMNKTARMEEKMVIFRQAIELYFHREYERKQRMLEQALILSKPQAPENIQ